MTQYSGRATITVNGQVIDTEAGAQFDPGSVTRTSETSDQRSGYSEALRPAKLMCKVKVTRGVSLKDLSDISGATVQFIADTGQSYVMANAWRVGESQFTAGQNGGVDLELNANECVEVGVG